MSTSLKSSNNSLKALHSVTHSKDSFGAQAKQQTARPKAEKEWRVGRVLWPCRGKNSNETKLSLIGKPTTRNVFKSSATTTD
jgi:hypothetical protein